MCRHICFTNLKYLIFKNGGSSKEVYFLYFIKYKVFFNGTFLRTLLMYVCFYIFSAISFWNIEVWEFEIFKKYESIGITGAHVLNTLSHYYDNVNLQVFAPHDSTTFQCRVGLTPPCHGQRTVPKNLILSLT
jgi:hypothetical protein